MTTVHSWLRRDLGENLKAVAAPAWMYSLGLAWLALHLVSPQLDRYKNSKEKAIIVDARCACLRLPHAVCKIELLPAHPTNVQLARASLSSRLVINSYLDIKEMRGWTDNLFSSSYRLETRNLLWADDPASIQHKDICEASSRISDLLVDIMERLSLDATGHGASVVSWHDEQGSPWQQKSLMNPGMGFAELMIQSLWRISMQQVRTHAQDALSVCGVAGQEGYT